MRKRLTTLALAAVAATAIVPMTASPAHAWTCQIKDLPLDPDPGDVACDVVLTVAGFLCQKVGGPCG
jgi:hypothetical protein